MIALISWLGGLACALLFLLLCVAGIVFLVRYLRTPSE